LVQGTWRHGEDNIISGDIVRGFGLLWRNEHAILSTQTERTIGVLEIEAKTAWMELTTAFTLTVPLAKLIIAKSCYNMPTLLRLTVGIKLNGNFAT